MEQSIIQAPQPIQYSAKYTYPTGGIDIFMEPPHGDACKIAHIENENLDEPCLERFVGFFVTGFPGARLTDIEKETIDQAQHIFEYNEDIPGTLNVACRQRDISVELLKVTVASGALGLDRDESLRIFVRRAATFACYKMTAEFGTNSIFADNFERLREHLVMWDEERGRAIYPEGSLTRNINDPGLISDLTTGFRKFRGWAQNGYTSNGDGADYTRLRHTETQQRPPDNRLIPGPRSKVCGKE
jgi:hypothetical protein